MIERKRCSWLNSWTICKKETHFQALKYTVSTHWKTNIIVSRWSTLSYANVVYVNQLGANDSGFLSICYVTTSFVRKQKRFSTIERERERERDRSVDDRVWKTDLSGGTNIHIYVIRRLDHRCSILPAFMALALLCQCLFNTVSNDGTAYWPCIRHMNIKSTPSALARSNHLLGMATRSLRRVEWNFQWYVTRHCASSLLIFWSVKMLEYRWCLESVEDVWKVSKIFQYLRNHVSWNIFLYLYVSPTSWGYRDKSISLWTL